MWRHGAMLAPVVFGALSIGCHVENPRTVFLQRPFAGDEDGSGREQNASVLRREIVQLRGEVASLKDDNRQLTEVVSTVVTNKKPVGPEKEVARLQDAMADAEEQFSDERNDLQSRLKNASQAQEKAERLLKQKSEAYDRLKGHQQEVEDEAQHAFARAARAEGQLREANEQGIRSLQEARQQMRNDEVSFEMAFQKKAEQERNQLQSKIVQEMDEVRNLESENAELRDRGESLLNETEQMRPELFALRANTSAAQQDRQQMLKTVQGLLRENADYKSSVSKYVAQLKAQKKEMAVRDAANKAEIEWYKRSIANQHQGKQNSTKQTRAQEKALESARRKSAHRHARKNAAKQQAGHSRRSSKDGAYQGDDAQETSKIIPEARGISSAKESDDMGMMGELAKLDSYISRAKLKLQEERLEDH